LSTARYFQDELDYLRNSGQDFARHFPKLTNYLSERSTDPDVERLLEGFALLTGRLREKIDDQLPEVTQSLLMLLWPNFLRPVPSMVVLQMNPRQGAINESQTLPAGLEVESIPVGGTVCKFRTAYDTEILPIGIRDVHHGVSKEKSVITMQVESLAEEEIRGINLTKLRFHLGGSDYSALTLGLWLHRYLKMVKIRDRATGNEIALGKDCVRQVGLQKSEEVLPYPDNSFVGYRLLQEFYAFPQKYYFVDLLNIPTAHLGQDATQFEVVFEFERPLPPDVRIGKQSFLLHCVPAINLFEHDAEPILLDGRRTEYHIRPTRRDAGEIEVFSIDGVTGWRPSEEGHSGGISREFSRFESFMHEIERVDGRAAVYFREKVRQSLSGEKLDRLISFVREDELYQVNDGETVSVRLTCSNGATPRDLAVGDICIPTHMIPSFVNPTNVTRPTPPRYPVVDGALQWQLISALSLNYLSLQSVEALRTILNVFDFNAKVDRQREREAVMRLEGIANISSHTIDRLFKGLPVRGMRSTIDMRESKFASEGEMYLFSTVLAEFFALYATINSFHELVVRGLEAGEEYRWTARIGNQPLI
jgi:type VI secretion system protein ImpG